MKIYTKTGDKGETGIIGNRILKNSPLIEAIGNFDELNASLGIVISLMNKDTQLNQLTNILSTLFKIQDAIFEVSSILANTNGGIDYLKLTNILEKEIDELDKNLKPLKNFILPGGNEVASFIHLSRTICRRAERSLVNLIEFLKVNKINLVRNDFSDILIFTNRLSDYLFILSRYINLLKNIDEIIWNKDKNF